MSSIIKPLFNVVKQLNRIKWKKQSDYKNFRSLSYRNYATLYKRLANKLDKSLSEEQLSWVKSVVVVEYDEEKLIDLYFISDEECMIVFISLMIYLVGGIDLPKYIIDEYVNIQRKLLQDII